MRHLAIIGCGWLGRHLICAMPEPWSISATTGHQSSADALPVASFVYDWTKDNLPAPLLDASHFVIAIPPTAGGYAHYGAHLARLAKQLPNDNPIILISSSSVYPSKAGVYDEDSAADPNSAVYQGEQALRKACPQAMILRCSGLIGTDRLLGVRFFGAVCDKANGRLNLAHHCDVTAAIIGLLTRPQAGATYNIAHPDHILRHDFYRLMAQVSGQAEPQFSNHTCDADRIISGQRITEQTDFNYAQASLGAYFSA
ncbi:sugar nucleotide-binding protein [Suttonella sp. R2A3]|uniref:sugar nucleotide-binding protein n=1 Tax=Suttonella sp. R2A3 TaxID=2908648 RepID=UPI001F3BC4D8|nr:sugar nucleotide-binding protein [Suttonella sp. R2A3]UJF23915.1 sugar nucleotide-binding protein [Suttonella sp. R2A3]